MDINSIKPTVLEQLNFFKNILEENYQVFETPNGQVITVRETLANSIVSINFLEPPSYTWEWIDNDNDILEYLVQKVNEYLSTSPIERKIVTYYKDNSIIDDKLQGLQVKQFVIGFDSAVNINSGNFDVVFNAIRTSIFEILDVKEPTQNISSPPEAFKSFIENTKKEIEQLIFLRSLQSPLDFEENIKLNQLLASKQEQLDKEIFGQNEIFMSQDNIFDDLFEQSFTPIQNSYNNIFAKDENASDFFTPNGERSSLNDAENALIRSSLFVEWFGDWQLAYQYKEAGIKDFACSKVLSPKFEPQVVWHGTGDEFSYFRFDNFPAAYFAVNKAYSQWFADLHAREGEGYTIPFFLSVNNPLDLTLFETRKIDPKTFFDYIFLQTGLTKDELDINPIFADSNLGQLETWMYLRNNPKMLKKLADSKLFDGIHFYETNPSIDESEPFYKTEAWIIFSPHQAKLADPSRGLLLFSSLKSFLLEKGGKI
jgi:hypothetical protein